MTISKENSILFMLQHLQGVKFLQLHGRISKIKDLEKNLVRMKIWIFTDKKK